MLLLHTALFLLTFSINYGDAVDPIGTGGPTIIGEGSDALLTCVITGSYANDTVLWRKGPNEILSAGINRVTSDKRISILHDDSPKGRTPTGGDVWVLLIRDAKPTDTDVYVCEVNSDPVLRSFHPLRVKNFNSTTNSSSEEEGDASYSAEQTTPVSALVHDFTDCCTAQNVSSKCMGYCTVHNILDGTTGIDPEACEVDFPSIVKCMADGRNHMPCCEKRGVPDLCQDMCRGEYTPFTDLLKSRVSCAAHTLPALQCILLGIQKLPSEPQDVYVEPLSERSLQVGWTAPAKLASTVKSYQVNVSLMHSFDQDWLANDTSALSVTVPGDLDSTVVNDLKPFTMYSIVVTANNDYGSSLPSFRIRTLTLESGVAKQKNVAEVPMLPDVRGCCENAGMTHRTCLERMCDPKKADFTEIPDLMVCAPWANITFSCLANNIDHSPCCKNRGIPDSCLPFCAGTVKTINFNFFKCLQYMSEYSSCLLQGYGVLAGPPSRLKAPLVSAHFAVLEWNAPKVLPDTVTSYHLHLRKLGSGDEYTVIEKSHPPMILEDLEGATYYEAFIVAVNAHGKGGPSPRLVFQTKHAMDDDSPAGGYNLTACCSISGLLPQCMPLCSYDIRMSDLQALAGLCQPQMGVLVKCAAGGRDHSGCCVRRAVPPKCLSLCHGVVSQSSAECLPYAGNVLQCLEEGTGNIPGPVEDLRATSVTNTTISLAWEPSEADANNTEAKVTDYLVQYGKVNNMTMYETIVKLENELNTTETGVDLNNLEPSALYRILVVARGQHGVSLPSAMLLINTSRVDYAAQLFGAPSPPHSLAVAAHSATWVTVSWQPPEFSHPHEPIVYKLYHKSTSSDKFQVVETRLLWTRIMNLKPNSQHVVYVTASGAQGVSLPSETLVAWTDPALPAHVDPPTIHPADMVAEGGSMTVLCLALGNPEPTISLYVGGHLVRQDTSRHMVTVIHNVSTDMEHVSCYADNGYGIPMQASKKVNISYAPRIKASEITLASIGEQVDLKCTVKAKPSPKAMFWRDHDGRVPVIQGGNYDMSLTTDPDDPSLYTMVLHITKLGGSDVGDYYCHAQNALGSVTRAVSVRMRNTPAVHNISECCISQNVSSACMSACSFYIDIDAVIDRPECIVDFDKLMKCAADGSDHRACCANQDVPRKCLNWCRGESLGNGQLCPVQHTRTIIGCFQSNRDLLPGPPQNLGVTILSNEEVMVRWDPPIKNPQTVEGYRVFWHDVNPSTESLQTTINGLGTSRLDAKETSIRIDGLKQHVMYELVVKAGNHQGASVLTEPLRFTLGDHHVTSASHSTSAGTISGVFAGILAIGLAVSAIFLYKRRKGGHKAANGVAFENPSYLREVNMEHVHIPAVSGDTGTEPGWRQEALQPPTSTTSVEQNAVVPMATEVNPTLYEELKLGHEGVGFKRLVS
ncbi:Ig-like and fibronectin type-III domain-containing protein 1 [Lutzomyia longipalpis]|uniref:Ig-like and fibronectin type-III domain-containing protein 1 n=1 Tax=Lutzomyia longipalpis TaxID=7200 RepID=UPI00248380FB|nr:Ig-like and fibronectin type-III domain-containing protein 1 [Lutzomyia longipalpis]